MFLAYSLPLAGSHPHHQTPSSHGVPNLHAPTTLLCHPLCPLPRARASLRQVGRKEANSVSLIRITHCFLEVPGNPCSVTCLMCFVLLFDDELSAIARAPLGFHTGEGDNLNTAIIPPSALEVVLPRATGTWEHVVCRE